MAVNVKNFDLQKKVEKFDRFLLDKGVTGQIRVRAGLALDISMSMQGIIQQGLLEKTVDQVMPVAIKFDDNGELDVFKFDTVCEYVGTVDQDDYGNVVRNKGIRARGGTTYAPIVYETVKFFYPEAGNPVAATAKKAGGLFKSLFGGGTADLVKEKPAAASSGADPALVLIVTDGDCSDADEAERAFVWAQKYGIYFHFVAVGNTSFHTVKRLANKLPNVGDVYLPRFGMSDEEVYAKLVTDELVEFLHFK